MFYISKIYDSGAALSFNSLTSSSSFKNYSISNDAVSCSYENLRTISVCVYDSSDKSEECYFVIDLLKMIEDYNLDISGVNFTKPKKPKYSDIPYSLSSIYIYVSLAEASNSYINNVAKRKLSGYDINTRGVLKSIDYSVIKDRTLVIPDEVRYIDSDIRFINNTNDKVIDTIVLSNNVDLTNLDGNVTNLGNFIKRYGLTNCILVTSSYVKLTYQFLFYIRVDKIIVKGNLSVGNIKELMKNLINYKRYWRSDNREAITIVTNSYIYRFSFITNTASRVTNYRGVENIKGILETIVNL